MTETPAPDAAVQIAADVLAGLGYGPGLPYDFHAVLAALARADWLHDPAEVAALRAVAKVARTYFGRQDPAALDAVDSALAALDAAAPAGTTAETGVSDNPQP